MKVNHFSEWFIEIDKVWYELIIYENGLLEQTFLSDICEEIWVLLYMCSNTISWLLSWMFACLYLNEALLSYQFIFAPLHFTPFYYTNFIVFGVGDKEPYCWITYYVYIVFICKIWQQRFMVHACMVCVLHVSLYYL